MNGDPADLRNPPVADEETGQAGGQRKGSGDPEELPQIVGDIACGRRREDEQCPDQENANHLKADVYDQAQQDNKQIVAEPNRKVARAREAWIKADKNKAI